MKILKKTKKFSEIHIFATASLTDVMKEIAALYKKENLAVKIIFNFTSIGALQQAIETAARQIYFFSTAQKQIDALEKSGDIVEGSRKNLLENEIVLIVPADGDKNISSFDDLTDDEVKHIVLGEPKGVPVGQYSEEILKALNIFDAVKLKAVYGSDVRKVLAWVESGDADCVIVYATDAKVSDKVKAVAIAAPNTHKPVIYPAAIIKDNKNLDDAKKFLNFVNTDSAKKFL